MIIASIVALVILGLLTVLQLALALKAPLGRFAWGGEYKVLPAKLRVSSLVAIAIYFIFVAFILSKLGTWILITDGNVLNIGLWVIAVYSTLGVFLNAISKSKAEQLTMTPVSIILAICLCVITLS